MSKTDENGAARTKAFRDRDGNRFVIPSFIIRQDDPDAPSESDVILRALEVSVILDLETDKDWFEFDLTQFPHVRTEALSRALAHGAMTVLLFAGPAFDKAAVLSEGRS